MTMEVFCRFSDLLLGVLLGYLAGAATQVFQETTHFII